MPHGSVRIELNSEGIRELLVSSGVADMLKHKADAVKSAAEGRHVQVTGENIDVPLTVIDSSSKTRARMRVMIDHPSGEAVEARYRLLGGSLDAAR